MSIGAGQPQGQRQLIGDFLLADSCCFHASMVSAAQTLELLCQVGRVPDEHGGGKYAGDRVAVGRLHWLRGVLSEPVKTCVSRQCLGVSHMA